MIILASQSPRRSDILKELGLDFKIIPSRYEERHDISNEPEELARLHARGKADEVYRCIKKKGACMDCIVLGADTLVYKDHEILGKPKDRGDAKRMIRKLSGGMHMVMSAICMIRVSDGKTVEGLDSSEVTFRDVHDEEIEKYLDEAQWRDKAGAYGIQGYASRFILSIVGDVHTVIGLPVGVTLEAYTQLRETA